MPGTSFSDAIAILSSDPVNCVISTPGQKVYYSFIPPISAIAVIKGLSTIDNIARLYNSVYTPLAFNDDGGGDLQFLITWSVTAGQTYYLKLELSNTLITGNFNFSVSGIFPATHDWDDFNQGLLIGLQISDKTRLGYNVDETIKAKDIGYGLTTPGYWTVIR